MDIASINDKAGTGFSTIEKEAIRKVLRESLQEELPNTSSEALDRTLQNIDVHSKAIQELIGTQEYSSLCIHQLIHNIKHMSFEEQQAYLSSIESFAKAYSLIFSNKRLMLLTLSGVVHTTSNARSVDKYTYELYKIARQKQLKLLETMTKESIALQALRSELEKRSKGIFAFLRSSQIKQLNRKIALRTRRIQYIEKKAGKYSALAKSISALISRR